MADESWTAPPAVKLDPSEMPYFEGSARSPPSSSPTNEVVSRVPDIYLAKDGYVYDKRLSKQTRRHLAADGANDASEERKARPRGSRPDGFRNRQDRDWIHDFDDQARAKRLREYREHRQAQELAIEAEARDPKRKKKSLEEILSYLSGNFAGSGSDSESRQDRAAPSPIRKRSVLFRRRRRQRSVYDAVAGLVSAHPRHTRDADGNILPPQSIKDRLHALPYSADEILFRRSNFPARYEEDDIYYANERNLDNAGDGILPDSDLLKILHTYVAGFYDAHRPASRKYRKIDMRSMDGTALLAFGILVEEIARHYTRRSFNVLTEGRYWKRVGVKPGGRPKVQESWHQNLEPKSRERTPKRQKLETPAPEEAGPSPAADRERLPTPRQARIEKDPFSSQVQRELLHYRKLKPIHPSRRAQLADAPPRINVSPDRQVAASMHKRAKHTDTSSPSRALPARTRQAEPESEESSDVSAQSQSRETSSELDDDSDSEDGGASTSGSE